MGDELGHVLLTHFPILLKTLLRVPCTGTETIIWREETAETRDPLPLCVEVRASRSQRHCNPRNYLTSRMQEPSSVVTTTLDKNADERQSHMLPLHSGSQTNFVRTPIKA